MGRRQICNAVAALMAGLSLSAPAAVGDDGAAIPPCTLEPGPEATVTRIVDGETIALDDGSVVRLIGALAPRARDAGAAAAAWPPETDTIKTLSDLVLGKKVGLAFSGRRTDRYGRLLAHVFLKKVGGDEWVQGALLAGGHARAYGLTQSFACGRELLAHEELARRARRGLWANGVYATLSARRPDALMAQRGNYERVIGSVVSVGRTKGATYLNFSNDWKTDFTARIGKSVLAANPDFDRSLDGLSAKTVIVRGWIERRNGPLIDVADPSQVEILDGDQEPAVSALPPPSGTLPAQVPANEAPSAGPDDGLPKDLRPAPPEGAEPGAVNL
jgi:endonuclease YncB( thermonuclease family)